MIVDGEGDARGIPKLRRLSLLEYLLGMHEGIPKLRRFYPKLLLPSFDESICDMLREGKIECASVGVSRHFV